MTSTETTFLLCTREDPELDWLQSSLASLGQVLRVDYNLEEVTRLIDVMSVPMVFVGVDRHKQVQQCALVESLVAARPMVSVIAVGDGYNSEVVIAAMRAGARDFLTIGLRGSEVLGLVRRQLSRLPQLPQKPSQSELTVLFGAQPDSDAALVATHLALEFAESGASTLLIDLGQPDGESKAMLGLECTFHFEDALRNLRRMDANVIESAFAHHEDSGLDTLPLTDRPFSLAQVNSSELFLLLNSLKQHYEHIVINLCGQNDGSLVRAIAGSANQLLWYADQSVPCSRRNLQLLQQWRHEGIKLEHASLVVDRYLPRETPAASVLAKTFGLPLAASLPLSPALRLGCRNHGQPVYELAAGDALSRALGRLAADIGAGGKRRGGFWSFVRRLR